LVLAKLYYTKEHKGLAVAIARELDINALSLSIDEITQFENGVRGRGRGRRMRGSRGEREERKKRKERKEGKSGKRGKRGEGGKRGKRGKEKKERKEEREEASWAARRLKGRERRGRRDLLLLAPELIGLDDLREVTDFVRQDGKYYFKNLTLRSLVLTLPATKDIPN
jgi:hypothetical protein